MAAVLLALATVFAAVRHDLLQPIAPSSLTHHVTSGTETPAGRGGMNQQRPDSRDEVVVSADVSIDLVRAHQPLSVTAMLLAHRAALGFSVSHAISPERPTDRPRRRTLVLLI